MIQAGAPLKAIAQYLEVPLWARRLPPEAFGRNCMLLPRSNEFGLAIANYIPAPRNARSWLETVEQAYAWADEKFAIWVARHHEAHFRGLEACDLSGLALFAWFSEHPHLEAGRRIERTFEDGLTPGTAVERIYDWLDVLDFPIHCAPYFTHGQIAGS